MGRKLIISISGLRGVVGENFDESIAQSYSRAIGTFLIKDAGEGKEKLTVCLGRDSRTSGSKISRAVIEGLCDVGVDVIDLGIVSTPGVGVMVKKLECEGGVIITASHNPAEYNGIKVLLDGGMAPPMERAQAIKETFLSEQFSVVESERRGKIKRNERACEIHVHKVLETVDADVIQKKTFRVVLDSVHGAGGREGRELLNALGCDLIEMYNEPTGLFPHNPEPTADSLGELCDKVSEHKADIGFAQDTDADRLAVVDENGRYIGEDYTLALVAKFILSKRKGKVATTLSTSKMIQDVVEQAGGELIYTAVGEANVVDAMIKNQCVIGGEGNGGVINLSVCPIRNSLVGMAFILQLMAESGKTINQLADGIKSYVMKKDKFEADENLANKILQAAKESFPEARLNTLDGSRFDFEDGWMHLRMSNTEPIMRVIVEAENDRKVQEYLDAALGIRNKVLS